MPFRTFCQPIAAYSALFFSSPLTISMLCQLLCKYSELGTEALYAMAPHPALKEFCEGALANGHLLNRYVTDMSNCLLFDKVRTKEEVLLFCLLFNAVFFFASFRRLRRIAVRTLPLFQKNRTKRLLHWVLFGTRLV